MDGALAIIRKLEEHGVEYIFGYSGGAAIPIFDAIARSNTNIRLILTRHEQGAAHMADGYARASGKPGIVLVTSGPGAGNVVTGLMTAHMDSVPIIILSGQQITSMLGYDAFQEADIFNITMPVTKHNYLVRDVNELPRIIDEAFYLATTGRPGPVSIDIPKDISSAEFSGRLDQPLQLPAYKPTPKPSAAKLKMIMEAWEHARRPLILAGHGVLISEAASDLARLAEETNTPVTTTLLGKGAFSESHRLALGMLGMHGTAYANKAVVECDFLLNVGSRFDDRIVGDTSDFCKGAFIAHIDTDASELGKMITPNIAVQADAKATLQQLLKLARNASWDMQQSTTWNHHLTGYKRRYPLSYDNSHGMTMQYVIDTVYKQTFGDATVVTDVGQHQMWAAQFYRTSRPHKWLSSGGAGTMGYGVPAAIGAQFAQPDAQVIAFVGDGGFQMTEYELATACIHKLPIKIFILNNHYLGMVRQWQELFYDNRESGVDLVGNPDFVMLAEAYGAKGICIETADQAEAKIAEALAVHDRPVIVNAEVVKYENVFPMVPAGAALSAMIVHRPTKKLAKPTGST